MSFRKREITSMVLFAIYAFFFASANLCYHSHQTADSRIVHSHPWSDKVHNHTANGLLLVKVLATSAYEQSPTLVLAEPVPAHHFTVASVSPKKAILTPYGCTFSLRAPPSMI